MGNPLHDVVPLVVAVALPFGLLCGAAQLLRPLTRARDARLVDRLIAANKARWCTDNGTSGGKPMDQVDWRRIERAGERRWQETLKWCSVGVSVNQLTLETPRLDECVRSPPEWWWRFAAIAKLRQAPTRRVRPHWVATELLYCLTNEHRDWADTIFVVTIVGGLDNDPIAEVASPGRGARIVRLHYHWETEIEPWLHLPPRALSDTRLTELAGFGWLLRARVRAAARSAQ